MDEQAMAEVLTELRALRVRVSELEGRARRPEPDADPDPGPDVRLEREPVSRRRLLGAAAAGLGALGLAAAEAAPAAAATGDPLLLGRSGAVNTAGETTELVSTAAGAGLRVVVPEDPDSRRGVPRDGDAALVGNGPGSGVLGQGFRYGVLGRGLTENGVGVRAEAFGTAVEASGGRTGVRGVATAGSIDAPGVRGEGPVGVSAAGTFYDVVAQGTGVTRQRPLTSAEVADLYAGRAFPYATGSSARDDRGRLVLREQDGWTRAASVRPGYAGGAWHALERPVRMLDTRAGRPGATSGGGPVSAGAPRTVRVVGEVEGLVVPADAALVVGNIAVTGARSPGFVTVVPHGQPQGTTSTINYVAGQTVANALTVAVRDGKVDLHVSGGPVHVVLDVVAFVL